MAEAWDAELQLDEISYNAAMAACGKGQEWQMALELFQELRQLRRFQPLVDPYSWGSIVAAMAWATEWQQALVLWTQSTAEWRGDVQRAKEGPVIANACMSALEKASQWQRALQIFSALRKPTLQSFGPLVSSCAKAREWRQALEFLSLSRLRRFAPTLELYGPALSAAAIGRAWRLAQRLLTELQQQRLGVAALNDAAMAAELAMGASRGPGTMVPLTLG